MAAPQPPAVPLPSAARFVDADGFGDFALVVNGAAQPVSSVLLRMHSE
eukprot:gene4809-2393_t